MKTKKKAARAKQQTAAPTVRTMKSKFDGLKFRVVADLAATVRPEGKLGQFVSTTRALRQPFTRDAACPPGETKGAERMRVTGYFEHCVRKGIFRRAK
jgi:hypothetical protein